MSRPLTMPAAAPRPHLRRVLAVVLVAMVAATLAVAPDANAADPTGSLQVKSVGSAYSAASNGAVAAVVAAGSQATFSVKVVNPGAAAADYRLRVVASPTFTVAATVPGGLFPTALVAGADGYPITGVPASGSKVVTIKMTPPKTSPQQTFTTTATLATVGGTDLDTATLLTSIKAPAKGHSAYTLLVSPSGSSNAVGGDVSGQSVSSPSIGTNGTTSFKVVVRNDSQAKSTVRLVTDFQYCAVQGFYRAYLTSGFGPDLASAAHNPGLLITLAPGQTKNYTLSFKRDDAFRPPCAQFGGTVALMPPVDYAPWERTVEVIAHPSV